MQSLSSAAMGSEETLYKKFRKNPVPVSRLQVNKRNLSRHRSQLNQSKGRSVMTIKLPVVLNSNVPTFTSSAESKTCISERRSYNSSSIANNKVDGVQMGST